ncbi:MAG: hypothetical protein COY72_00595 [Candidatus Nealsonbacteria bacterium CG_4_10_14_0_8_um_filter_35_10]|uniref:Uncharacterized protein n=2 Tax=Candidatus Nealsoniibacteriota TaxID=1817911 RepID=A0A2M7R8Q6_9BACT|nr:MAG: hypothetical protein AUJ24_01355 [Parcubacteria group bacterium CG1_02_36_42]PIY90978.1 MAG: hypothetical protein COY72_00595 [Candidatus Nealsonbacteria bacterium CG_4_10_14_0_8_um_filter_35_10]PJB99349.1 MAG: hypothetical protein CO077_02300 [Candidatus Nealsonbacteria bacterium CG_4_9_14_0_8_um_filter_35_12]
MNKKVLNSKQVEELQNEIYRKMPAGKKLRIASQLISLAKKIKEAKEVTKKKNDNHSRTTPLQNS